MSELERTHYYERFDSNLKRVDNLLSIYQIVKETETEAVRSTDVLRAAVVFLHASQEDYFRGVLSDWLVLKADAKHLKDIALMGTDGRAQKFTLQDLLPFSEKSILDVLNESVRQAMSKTSFNQYSEICAWLNKVSISVEGFKGQEKIGKLISRRHRIVHEVDLANTGKSSVSKTASLDKKTVESWKNAVIDLLQMVDEQVMQWL